MSIQKHPAFILSLVLAPLIAFGPNALLCTYAVIVLAIGVWLLWRPGESPILIFIFAFQWIQAAIAPFYANLVGISIDDFASYYGRHSVAIALMLTGLLALAIGMRLGAGRQVGTLAVRAREMAAAKPLSYWLRLYIAAWIFSALCATLSGFAGGLRQVLLTLAGVKWAAFVLLTVATFSLSKRSRQPWMIVVALEFAFALAGYFSRFSAVFFFALFGMFLASVRLDRRLIVRAATISILLIVMGVVWTAIKPEYRAFLNQGTGQQVVLVSYAEAVGEMGRLVGELEARDLDEATHSLILRLSYFEYFGVVLIRVPWLIPHSEGEIWLRAFTSPFMPRLLFPEKPAVHDSVLTNFYTGLGVATHQHGASISMGYLAEAYIDFGYVGMIVTLGFFGAGMGWFYRWLVRRPGYHAVIGSALATSTLMAAANAGASILKLAPALALGFIACVAVLTLFVNSLGLPSWRPVSNVRQRRGAVGR